MWRGRWQITPLWLFAASCSVASLLFLFNEWRYALGAIYELAEGPPTRVSFLAGLAAVYVLTMPLIVLLGIRHRSPLHSWAPRITVLFFALAALHHVSTLAGLEYPREPSFCVSQLTTWVLVQRWGFLPWLSIVAVLRARTIGHGGLPED